MAHGGKKYKLVEGFIDVIAILVDAEVGVLEKMHVKIVLKSCQMGVSASVVAMNQSQ